MKLATASPVVPHLNLGAAQAIRSAVSRWVRAIAWPTAEYCPECWARTEMSGPEFERWQQQTHSQGMRYVRCAPCQNRHRPDALSRHLLDWRTCSWR